MSISQNAQNGPVIFQFSNNFVIFRFFLKKNTQFFENWKMTGPFWTFWDILILELVFERYTTIPFQEKNPDQKILFFHGEIWFSKCGIWAEYLEICQVVILFRRGLHIHQKSETFFIFRCFSLFRWILLRFPLLSILTFQTCL